MPFSAFGRPAKFRLDGLNSPHADIRARRVERVADDTSGTALPIFGLSPCVNGAACAAVMASRCAVGAGLGLVAVDGWPSVEAVGVGSGFVQAFVEVATKALGAVGGAVFGALVFVFDDLGKLKRGIPAAWRPCRYEVATLFWRGGPSLGA
jgi:hypothetical protein